MANYPFVENSSTGGGGNVPALWVANTTYSAGIAGESPPDVVLSASDFLPYIRIVAGAGATDPSSDTTNWKPYGARAIKSIQRGVLSLAVAATTVDATITAVNVSKTELRALGFNGTTADSIIAAHLTLLNSTTVRATKAGLASIASAVSWELTEYY